MRRVTEEERRGWAQEVEAWRASGQTLSAWARDRGISRDRLEYWKRRGMRRSEKPDTTIIAPLTLIPVVSAQAQPVPAAPIELLVERAGLRIVLPTDFDTAGLTRLLDVVIARC